jgi:hypothetical protein
MSSSSHLINVGDDVSKNSSGLGASFMFLIII